MGVNVLGTADAAQGRSARNKETKTVKAGLQEYRSLFSRPINSIEPPPSFLFCFLASSRPLLCHASMSCLCAAMDGCAGIVEACDGQWTGGVVFVSNTYCLPAG